MTQLIERVQKPGGRVDRQAGVIRGVKILGRHSKNGREYSSKALDDAARLYENIRVRIDHPSRSNPDAERSIHDTIGTMKNVRRKGDAVFGDLHYIKSHPAAEHIVEAAEHFPHLLGLSHNADGKTRRERGRDIVESIARVRSVDLVDTPATNKNLYESEGAAMDVQAIEMDLKTAFSKAVTELAGADVPDAGKRIDRITKLREKTTTELLAIIGDLSDAPADKQPQEVVHGGSDGQPVSESYSRRYHRALARARGQRTTGNTALVEASDVADIEARWNAKVARARSRRG